MPRKRTSDFSDYESRKAHDIHYRITRSMVDSEAWRSLRAHDIAVYMMLKNVHYKKTQHGAIVDDNFKRLIITYQEAWDCIGISKARFKKAIDQLEKVGLIDVVARSRNMKHANVYGLSARWHDYKAPAPGKKWPTQRKSKKAKEKGDADDDDDDAESYFTGSISNCKQCYTVRFRTVTRKWLNYTVRFRTVQKDVKAPSVKAKLLLLAM